MRYCIPLNSRIFLPAAVPAIQGGRIHATRARAFATVGSRPATDHMETPRPKMKYGLEKETMYIAGGLAAIGAIWYYYATMEHARIEKKRGRLDPRIATVSAANAEGVDDAARSAKGRAQEAFKKVQ